MDNLIQFLILGLSGLAIWLATGNSGREKKAGATVGVFAQVFWIVETWQHDQWGMLFLSIWYLIIFFRIIISESHNSKDRPASNAGAE